MRPSQMGGKMSDCEHCKNAKVRLLSTIGVRLLSLTHAGEESKDCNGKTKAYLYPRSSSILELRLKRSVTRLSRPKPPILMHGGRFFSRLHFKRNSFKHTFTLEWSILLRLSFTSVTPNRRDFWFLTNLWSDFWFLTILWWKISPTCGETFFLTPIVETSLTFCFTVSPFPQRWFGVPRTRRHNYVSSYVMVTF